MTTEDTAEAPEAVITLRRSKGHPDKTVFVELCEQRGLKTVAAIARHIGMSDKTVSRIVENGQAASGKFIAQALARWPMCSFRSLFAVADETTGEELR